MKAVNKTNRNVEKKTRVRDRQISDRFNGDKSVNTIYNGIVYIN